MDALRKSDQTELDNRETTALKWQHKLPLETRQLTLYAAAGRQEESVNEVLQSLRSSKDYVPWRSLIQKILGRLVQNGINPRGSKASKQKRFNNYKS